MVTKVWGRHRGARPPSRAVPRVEALEERAVPSSTTYTTSADFALGNQLNVNATDTTDQLQLNKTTTPFPFINVAASGRGTMVRINTETGAILGEFWTAPQNRPKNPSRTTVDLSGNVWVTNRDEDTGGSGSIVKIGLVIGGTRGDKLPDGSFFANPLGEYLQGPFQYNTCVDKDGDGLIRTSRGLGNILAWPNTSGVDTDGGVETSSDEAVLLYVRLPNAGGARHVSVDANNDIWVGGYPGYTPAYFHKLDGDTGAILTSFNAATLYGAGGYGGFIDKNGVLWSSSLSQGRLLRYDTNTGTGSYLQLSQPYGLGVDTNGNVWNSQWTSNIIYKISPAGAIVAGFPKSTGGSGSRGVVVTPADNNVWIANSYSYTVTRLANDGTLRKTIGVGATPTGVAVDALGKVWVTNYDSHSVMRIDPAGGTDGLGAVDLTVSLGSGAYPYNYSDMTGIVSIGATSPQGTWTRVQDSGAADTHWGTLTWNTEPAGNVPPGTSLTVEARAANTSSGLPGQPWTTATSGVDLPVIGRYIEVRVTFRPSTGGLTPVLSDITIATEEPSEPPKVVSTEHYAASAAEESLTHQRSVIRHIKVTFDKPVTLADAGAFVLQKTGGPGGTGLVALTVDTLGPSTSFVLSFSGPLTEYGSLKDGSYQLTLVASKITAGGLALDGNGDGTGGDNKVDEFFRFFGDTDGDGDVDNTDSFRLTKVKNGVAAYAIYAAVLDFNNSGGYDAADMTQFMTRYGKKKTF